MQEMSDTQIILLRNKIEERRKWVKRTIIFVTGLIKKLGKEEGPGKRVVRGFGDLNFFLFTDQPLKDSSSILAYYADEKVLVISWHGSYKNAQVDAFSDRPEWQQAMEWAITNKRVFIKNIQEREAHFLMEKKNKENRRRLESDLQAEAKKLGISNI